MRIRLPPVLVGLLLVVATGALAPQRICDADEVGGFTCLAVMDAAERALPSSHAPINSITLTSRFQCFGYCPLIQPDAMSVTFRLSDQTRSVVDVIPRDGRLVATFAGSDKGG